MKKIFSALGFIALIIYSLSIISCSKDKVTNPVVGVDIAKLDEAFAQAQQIENLKCLIVSHNGQIIKEAFYKDGGPDIAHDVRSVTKSVTGLLIGIAFEKGFIQSIDQPIGDFIKPLVENLSTEKANIKILHLLTMSSGFEWEELISVSGYNNWVTSANQVQYLVDKPLTSQPGEVFTYNSAALHLLSVIASRASGMQTLDFARKYLFDSLGIGERNWETDQQGYNNGGAGLKITPYDMIKIGQLILNRGEYNGKRIVSSQWIDQTITSKISTNNVMPFTNGYGYCWWTGQSSKGNYVFANGYGGQFIVVVPNLNLVVVATNRWNGVGSNVANDQWYRTMDLIISRVLPAFN